MAKSHTTNGSYTNPEVRFERTDIDFGDVVKAALILTVTLVASAVLAVWLAHVLTRNEDALKRTTLPPARADDTAASRLPPEPRLEGIEDLRETDTKNFVIYPPRAASYYAEQERTLKRGNFREKVEPIGEAIDRLAGKLPARKEAAPMTFSVELPSDSSAGRSTTGGQ